MIEWKDVDILYLYLNFLKCVQKVELVEGSPMLYALKQKKYKNSIFKEIFFYRIALFIIFYIYAHNLQCTSAHAFWSQTQRESKRQRIIYNLQSCLDRFGYVLFFLVRKKIYHENKGDRNVTRVSTFLCDSVSKLHIDVLVSRPSPLDSLV